MSHSRLTDLKKKGDVGSKISCFDFLVVGSDLFSFATYVHLRKIFGVTNVNLVFDCEFSKDHLSLLGPSTLRGDGNIGLFKELFSDIKLDLRSPSQFYKEGRFRGFGGRSRSEKLLLDETFYTNAQAYFNMVDLFPFLDKEDFIDEVIQEASVLRPTKIERDVNNDHPWNVTFSNGDQVNCKQLIWGNGPKGFVDLIGNTQQISSELMQLCNSYEKVCSLFIRFLFDGAISEMKETMFIPVSLTHDWGHFIGEVDIFVDDRTQEQMTVIEFLHLLEPDATSEDDISKKIKILKRSLDKMFPGRNVSDAVQFVALRDYVAPQEIVKEWGAGSVGHDLDLYFVGQNVPIASSAFSGRLETIQETRASHFMNGLLSYVSIEETFKRQ